jgi:predicted dinucleotide-binding enzyme
VSRILVIGGYGGFGARITRRLLAAGHQVLVAGRNAEKAVAFCAGLDNAEPVVADRSNGVGMAMARERPDLVIDAAGPFQASGYTVPEACIAMRIPYLDLADGRAFVTGIGALDKAAAAASVAVIAGASSVPALSGAVARALAEHRGARQVEIAISASNRAVAGRSVAAAILSYVGKPLKLWRGGRWADAWGWQELRRERFAITGEKPLRRWVAIADVPDADLMPLSVKGHPAVTFRAGTELGFQMIVLWLLSWPVRWRWIESLAGAAGWLQPLQRLTGWAGSDRSAMSVTLRAPGIRRRWTLIASQGDGPEIPTLAAALLAEEILAGRVVPGARDAGELLTLVQFEPLFAGLAIRHEIVERPLVPLYARAMEDRFAALPPRVREMHEVYGDGGAQGEGTVVRGKGLARLIGAVMRFPPSGSYPLHVAFTERNDRERWTRDFGGHRFSSELSAAGEGVAERFGPLRFVFDLPSDGEGLRMVLRRWTAFGVPMPRFLGPRIEAREWEEGGRFRFEVGVRLPVVGDVVRYTGWLERGEER